MHSQALPPKQHISKHPKMRADTGKRPQTSRQQEWEAGGEHSSLTSI